jgi:hypothetical protein
LNFFSCRPGGRASLAITSSPGLEGALSGQQGSCSFITRSRTFAISGSPQTIFHSHSAERKWEDRRKSHAADLPAQSVSPPGSGESGEFMNENEKMKGGMENHRLTEAFFMISLKRDGSVY